MLKRVLCLFVFAAGLALLAHGSTARSEKDKEEEKPKFANFTFVPTADEVIEKLFELAKVKKNDVVFDLGCGDGRILYKAAAKFRCRGVGVEINSVRIREAMDWYEKYEKEHKIGTLVEVRHGDALRVKDLADATVVALYIFPEFLNLWFPIAEKTLKPGTRIVSHDYRWINGWEPNATVKVKSSSRIHTVYLWVVPEKPKK